MMSMHVPINKAYVFESDDESHINADDLSDLSDIFDDEEDEGVEKAVESVGISLDDIPYDRDLKWINVPRASRPKGTLVNTDSVGRVLKSVETNINTGRGPGRNSADDSNRRNEDRRQAQEIKVSVRKRDTEDANPARHAEYIRSRHADANAGERAHTHVHSHHRQGVRDDSLDRKDNHRGKKVHNAIAKHFHPDALQPPAPPQPSAPPTPTPPTPMNTFQPALQGPYQAPYSAPYQQQQLQQAFSNPGRGEGRSRKSHRSQRPENFPPPAYAPAYAAAANPTPPLAAAPPYAGFPPPTSPGSVHVSHHSHVSAAHSTSSHLNPQAQEFVPSFLSR